MKEWFLESGSPSHKVFGGTTTSSPNMCPAFESFLRSPFGYFPTPGYRSTQLHPFLAIKGERVRNGCHLLVSRGAEKQSKLHEVSSPSIVNRLLSELNWGHRF